MGTSARRTRLVQVRVHLRARLMQVDQRRAAEFELPAGLQRHGLPIQLGADDVVALHHRLPVEPSHERLEEHLEDDVGVELKGVSGGVERPSSRCVRRD
eukprot:31375-Pelagococcus_subviridis.AAC.9